MFIIYTHTFIYTYIKTCRNTFVCIYLYIYIYMFMLADMSQKRTSLYSGVLCKVQVKHAVSCTKLQLYKLGGFKELKLSYHNTCT